ncbi:type II CAAX prenyl endopeptidase Rce1 family protein [Paenarthrobacter sp. NPDC056912]|uniref:CPBP family glutamic-type intramembrane protease n=1 Tax=Paenarthrobacter sp. NPDC056912 TaxID=3345965 RepID=UPI00366B9FCF
MTLARRWRIGRSPAGVLSGALTVVVPYVVGFSFYIYAAVGILTGALEEGTPSVGAMAIVWGISLAGIGLGLLSARAGGIRGPELGFARVQPRRLTGYIIVGCLAYFFMWVAFRAAQLWPAIETTGDGKIPDPLTTFLYATNAGVTEEILILGIPVAVMTKLRLSGWVQIPVITVGRLLIHLYYGVPIALTLAVMWSILWWFLYRKHRTLIPFICAHVLYDLVVSAGAFGSAGRILNIAALAVLGTAVVVLTREAVMAKRNRTAPSQNRSGTEP